MSFPYAASGRFRSTSPAEYLAALKAAGMPQETHVSDIDAWAATALCMSRRTATRYRLGTTPVPGVVMIALKGIAVMNEHSGDKIISTPPGMDPFRAS